MMKPHTRKLLETLIRLAKGMLSAAENYIHEDGTQLGHSETTRLQDASRNGASNGTRPA